jgi:hypothetical protein
METPVLIRVQGVVLALVLAVAGTAALDHVKAVAGDAKELAAVPAQVLVAVDARDIINSLV